MFFGILPTCCDKEDSCLGSNAVGTFFGIIEYNKINSETATFLVKERNGEVTNNCF
jgi:hypothetical protein